MKLSHHDRIGVKDEFGEVGKMDYLEQRYQMSASHIEEAGCGRIDKSQKVKKKRRKFKKLLKQREEFLFPMEQKKKQRRERKTSKKQRAKKKKKNSEKGKNSLRKYV